MVKSTPDASDVEVSSRFSDAQVDDLSSFDDALRLLNDAGVVAEELPGLTVLEKDSLIGSANAFIVLEWSFNDGDNGEFVSATIMTKNNVKGVINDGGSGIYRQLRDLTDRRLSKNAKDPNAQRGLVVSGGLTRSEYETVIDGKDVHGVTFYLSK